MDIIAEITTIRHAIELIANAGTSQSPKRKESMGFLVLIDIHALNKISGDHRPNIMKATAKIINTDSLMAKLNYFTAKIRSIL